MNAQDYALLATLVFFMALLTRIPKDVAIAVFAVQVFSMTSSPLHFWALFLMETVFSVVLMISRRSQ